LEDAASMQDSGRDGDLFSEKSRPVAFGFSPNPSRARPAHRTRTPQIEIEYEQEIDTLPK
jgi:hypothetical protein